MDRSKAAAAYKALDRLWPEMEQAEALVVTTRRAPKLSLATPPAVGIRPLALSHADVAHAVGAAPILRSVNLELGRGQRLILRGPNGAGASRPPPPLESIHAPTRVYPHTCPDCTHVRPTARAPTMLTPRCPLFTRLP